MAGVSSKESVTCLRIERERGSYGLSLLRIPDLEEAV